MPPKGRIEVNDFYCKGCGLCVKSCPNQVISLAQDRLNAKGYHPAEQAADGCIACGICAMVCPDAAITVYKLVEAKG
jgi:2-oxoglutarate ferredoxin oxidoreductase subunit delta